MCASARASWNQRCGRQCPVFCRVCRSSSNKHLHGLADGPSCCSGTSTLCSLHFSYGLRFLWQLPALCAVAQPPTVVCGASTRRSCRSPWGISVKQETASISAQDRPRLVPVRRYFKAVRLAEALQSSPTSLGLLAPYGQELGCHPVGPPSGCP